MFGVPAAVTHGEADECIVCQITGEVRFKVPGATNLFDDIDEGDISATHVVQHGGLHGIAATER